MKNHILRWVCWSLALLSGPALAVQAVPQVDWPRYTGTWYEIALFPNRFQAQCERDTQAQYRLREDGHVEVRNRCTNAQGQVQEALGEARLQGGPNTPRLKVRFAPQWLAWLPLVWGDYWVVDLDPAYSLAAVSEPSRQYLWVLSRTPQVDPVAYQALLQRLQAQGLAVERLQRTPQGQVPHAPR